MKKRRRRKRYRTTRRLVVMLIVLLVLIAAGVGYQLLSRSKSSTHQYVVELDAVYGGDLTGNTGLVNESDFAQGVVEQLEKTLKNDSHFSVILTHEPGSSASVEQRAQKINQDEPDIVLSIRANADSDAAKSGMQIYADLPTSKYHEQSQQLADQIRSAFTTDAMTPVVYYYTYKQIKPDVYQIHLTEENDTPDDQEETLGLMEKSAVPVVAAAQMYVTSQSDVDAWANEAGYKQAAKLYYQALKDYFGVQ